jgi:hypothetical protein
MCRGYLCHYLRQYLYVCTSKASKLRTCLLALTLELRAMRMRCQLINTQLHLQQQKKMRIR